MNDLKRILLRYDGDIAYVLRRLPKLEAVAKAALSVLSEEGVREQLSCYVMGVELMGRLDALEADD